jgi:hypothetical protein
MRKRSVWARGGAGLFLGLSLLVSTAEARITRIEITSRVMFAGGMSFGDTGPYEKLRGKLFGEVDPADPPNAVIVDLDKAPRNARGMVEYVTDFLILKPVDMSMGNGKIFYGINNRGNTGALGALNDAATGGNDPTTAEDAGNGFLMRQGYAIVDAGWEGDVLPGNNRLTAQYPVVTDGGAEITGTIAVQYDVSRHIPVTGTVSLPLNRAGFDSYETASLDTSTALLTVRDLVRSPETPIPGDRWAFATCERNPTTGVVQNVVPSRKHICYFDGFDPDKLYQLVYTAKNPKPMALGYAVTRDVGSFLRFETTDDFGNPNPLARSSVSTGIGHVYALGVSSTGMYVRDFIYLGFNEDEDHRRVFDVMWPQIPGALRLHQNTRFTMPDIYSRQDLWAGLWPMATFPFSYGVTTDPITGLTDGILKRPATDPIVIHTDSSEEYWQFHGALVTTDGLGRDIPLPENVRVYFMSSEQHGPAAVPTRGICEQLSNPLPRGSINRAVLVALDEWVTKGIRPPDSRYPRVSDGTLVPPDRATTGFPEIPGVTYSGLVNSLPLRFYGPHFSSTGGVIDVMPPATLPGLEYAILAPKVDADGNDVAGVRVPQLEVPTATYTGWNHRAAGFREGDLCALTGMYLPFTETRAERLASGDPRLSLEERYRNHGGYVSRIVKAARALRAERFLLQEDFERIVEQAAESDVLK